MPPRRRLAVLLLLLGVSLTALFNRSRIQAWAMHTNPSTRPGTLAPEVSEAQTLDGQPFRVADLKGQVVLLHFWTFACGNCEHMLPSYSAWHARYRTRGLRVVGVHTPELPHERDVGKLRQVVRDKHLEWTVVSDNGETIWDRYGVRAWPTIFLIDRHGAVSAVWVGDDHTSEIENAIERLL